MRNADNHWEPTVYDFFESRAEEKLKFVAEAEGVDFRKLKNKQAHVALIITLIQRVT